VRAHDNVIDIVISISSCVRVV